MGRFIAAVTKRFAGGNGAAADGQAPVRKARGSEIPRSAQRIFVCWDKKDSSLRSRLVSDLLSENFGVDCVVSYYDKSQKVPNDEQVINELRENRLFVFLVTPLLLRQIKQDESPEFRLAETLNRNDEMPMLPIAAAESLLSLLAVDKNAVHGIAMEDGEYHSKLSDQLKNFIVSNDLVREISAKAFDGSIFLSYRKKDVEHARAFIRKFHEIYGTKSISVWYDNFLTAGRIFDREIKQAISKSDLFVILVTPRLLEKNAEGDTNFVLAVEVPYAVREGKTIIALEAVQTDRALVEEACHGIKDYITLDQSEKLLQWLPPAAFTEEFDEEQSYMLGMAYLRAILVEQNFVFADGLFENAVRPIGKPDSSKSPFAAKAAIQAARMWETVQNKLSFEKSEAFWLDAIAIQQNLSDCDSSDLAVSYEKLSWLYRLHNDLPAALKYQSEAFALNERCLGAKNRRTAIGCNNLGDIYACMANFDDAFLWYQRALDIQTKDSSLLPDLAATYNNLALLHIGRQEYDKALTFAEKAYTINVKAHGSQNLGSLTIRHNLVNLHYNAGNYRASLREANHILKTQRAAYGADNLETAKTLHKIALNHAALRKDASALALLEEVRAIQENIRAEYPFWDCADLARTYSFMGVLYAKRSEYLNAIKWSRAAMELYGRDQSASTSLALAELYQERAMIQKIFGDSKKVLEWQVKALEIQKRALGEEHTTIAATCFGIAAAYEDKLEFENARSWYEKSLDIRARLLGESHKVTAATREALLAVSRRVH